MNAPLSPDAIARVRKAEAAFHPKDVGYRLFRDVVPAAHSARIIAALDEGFARSRWSREPLYRARVKRFGRGLARTSAAAALVSQPVILKRVERIIGRRCDTVQPDAAQAIAIHPRALAQHAHRNPSMRCGQKGRYEHRLTLMWPITPFGQRNGATIMWPDSRRKNALMDGDTRQPLAMICDPGDAILFLSSTLPGAGTALTATCRRVIVTGSCVRCAYENLALGYLPDIARCSAPGRAALLNDCQHRLDFGNLAKRWPCGLLNDSAHTRLRALGALRVGRQRRLTMNRDQDTIETVETVDLGLVTEETRGSGDRSIELTGGRVQQNGISDLD